MDIYDRITSLLKARGKTRKDLSIAINTSYNTLTSLFQRRSENMNLATIHAISKYLDVTINYLIDGKETQVNIINEDTTTNHYNSIQGLELEIIRVLRKLDTKNKTILLAKAYELEEKTNK